MSVTVTTQQLPSRGWTHVARTHANDTNWTRVDRDRSSWLRPLIAREQLDGRPGMTMLGYFTVLSYGAS